MDCGSQRARRHCLTVNSLWMVCAPSAGRAALSAESICDWLATHPSRQQNVALGGDDFDVHPIQNGFFVQCKFDMGRDVGA